MSGGHPVGDDDADGVVSPLRQALDDAGGTLSALTVLAPHRDPFRQDTPANHRDGAWLAEQIEAVGHSDQTIHLRGLHYLLVSRAPVKPNGDVYRNTEADWTWLIDGPAKSARWLRYVPFDSIVDQRNTPPTIRVLERQDTRAYLSLDLDVDVPSADELTPLPFIANFAGEQPYRLALVGEKASLDGVLAPVANDYGADLLLPTGDISDTMVYRLAEAAADDGRPLQVFYFADCDPSGWNMAVVIGRKLQAFRQAFFPDLDFGARRVALTPDQVRDHDLPSTPLKATERRADRWLARTGVEQTEIDALATLRPDLLDRMARGALDPFFDHGLARRVSEVGREWDEQAQAAVAAQMEDSGAGRFRDEAVARLDDIRAELDELTRNLQIEPGDIDLPDIPRIPEPECAALAGDVDEPLISSAWDFAEQCRALLHSKGYGS